jgi:hypothetical protein
VDADRLQYLEEHYAASEWLRRPGTEGTVEDVQLTGSEIPGWTLKRARWHEHATPPFFHSVWTNADDADEAITIRIVECADASAAKHQLLVELGTFHSPAIERHDGADVVGDVSFGLGETMALFARANVVVTVLNAGKPVSVVAAARDVDTFIQQKIPPGSGIPDLPTPQ